MANHCMNELYITGKREDVQEIVNRIEFYKQTTPTDFEILYYGETFYTLFRNKYPHYYEDRVTKHPKDFDPYPIYGSKWWAISHYEILEGDSMGEDVTLFIDSSSAWSPVCGIAEKFAYDYNCEVTLKFNEPGMGFAGVNRYDIGGCHEENEMTSLEFDYYEDYEYFKERLIDEMGDYDSYEEFIDNNEAAIKLIKSKEDDTLLKELKEKANSIFV